MADAAVSPVFVTPDGEILVPLVGNPIGLWEGLRLALLRVRPRVEDPRGAYPAITHGDATQLVAVWARAIARDHDEARDVSGYRARWEAYAARIAPALSSADRSAPFSDARALWLEHSLDLARGLSLMYSGPTTAQQTLQSIAHGAQSIIKKAPEIALGFGGQQIAAAGRRIGSATSAGVWNAVKVPLAIGAVVLGAVLVVPLVLRRPGGG